VAWPCRAVWEPPLALDQWQVAQVVVVKSDQVEREQYRLMAAASAPQHVEVRRPALRATVRQAGVSLLRHQAERPASEFERPVGGLPRVALVGNKQQGPATLANGTRQ
jgi:hypothetical protein